MVEGGRVEDPLGRRFVRGLADRDAAGLKQLLRADVDFRGMTPREFWESADRDAIVDDILLGSWFEETDRVTEVVDVETAEVGRRHRVSYRMKVTNPDGDYVVEQQAYFESDRDRIGWLRIMCSGFLPDE
jgi:hypothetical protein